MLKSKEKNLERDLVVKSSTDNLSIIREFTKTSASDCGCSEELTGKIILAVDEACTNIIKHAYKYSANGDIDINIKLLRSKLIISITDSGDHFNSDSVPTPNLLEYQKQKKSGGLGIFLMKKLMDEVNYRILKDNRNQVELVKHLKM
jgi:serine/threonine-protein kinase RsbW